MVTKTQVTRPLTNKIKRILITFFSAVIILGSMFVTVGGQNTPQAGEHALGTKSYDDYETPEYCGSSCHIDFYQQWQQMMMSQAYTHHWDEIEYFKLAVPHAETEPKVAEVKDGCNGCHAPTAFMAGDTPPPHPAENSRANESVSCDVCHTIKTVDDETPFNFNFISTPG